MRTRFRPLVAFVALTMAAQLPASAQTATSEEALAEIATALARIAQVMEKQLEGGRLELLMRRVESSQRRVDQVEVQLRRTRGQIEGLAQERSRLEKQLADFADPAKVEAMGYDPATLDLQAESLEFELELTRRRLSDFADEVARMEEQKARLEREVGDWQAFIDRELAGLQ